MITVLTGSYTPDTGGEGVGVAVLRLDPESGRLTLDPTPPVPASGASFLASHPSLDVVYATVEADPGAVSAFVLGQHGGPVPLGDPVASGGANPCHLTVHPSGRWLLTANYGGDTEPGRVAVHRLDEQGRPAELTHVIEHIGSGPVAGRQDGSHAHQILVDPAGRYVLATDLGADTVFAYRLDPGSGTLERAGASAARAGSGPRHLAFAPSGDLVWSSDEPSSTLTCHRYDAPTGALSEVSSAGTTGHDGPNQPGGIVASPDGRFVWVTNRGADTIAAFRVDGAEPKPLGEFASGGHWPRGLTLVAGLLLVANQYSGTLAALRIMDDGTLEPSGPPVQVPSVVCALPVRP